MNPRTFLKQFAEDIDRDRMINMVFDEMVEYCEDNGISLDELSNEELEEIAEGFVARGFTFEGENDEWDK